jgi:hypothetical protein
MKKIYIFIIYFILIIIIFIMGSRKCKENRTRPHAKNRPKIRIHKINFSISTQNLGGKSIF